jgi:hypothetical protein
MVGRRVMFDPFNTCEPCGLRDAGKLEKADLLESVRGQRLLLALLNGAPDVMELICSELQSCHDCVGRLAAQYLGSTATALIHLTGSVDNAAGAISATLSEDMDKV